VTCSRCDGLGKRDLNHEQTRYSFQLQKLVSSPEPKVSTQGRSITEEDLEQLKLVSDYIKFHMGLYLATPPVLVILAEGLGVTNSGWWVGSLLNDPRLCCIRRPCRVVYGKIYKPPLEA
jgi:hypothetical protein